MKESGKTLWRIKDKEAVRNKLMVKSTNNEETMILNKEAGAFTQCGGLGTLGRRR